MNVPQLFSKLSAELSTKIIGKTDIIEEIFIALLCDGHILLEGVPGTAKTIIANSISKSINCSFKRIQFTPDLLPSDILGTFVFSLKTREFELRRGPIFANFILADEINRAPPKTQAALLECMQETQVTLEGYTYKLKVPFIVIATQNPIDMEGTYPLPEAQLDRFMFKSNLTYPSRDEEIRLLAMKNLPDKEIKSVISPADIEALKKELSTVKIDESIYVYITDIIQKIRGLPDIELGPGPRASIAFLKGAKAYALMSGREYVIPDDVKRLGYPILRHRIRLKPEAQIAGITVSQLISKAVNEVPIPKVMDKSRK
ncbi:MAG: MoxR family ATPase [Nanoarchaeota archaeon]